MFYTSSFLGLCFPELFRVLYFLDSSPPASAKNTSNPFEIEGQLFQIYLNKIGVDFHYQLSRSNMQRI